MRKYGSLTLLVVFLLQWCLGFYMGASHYKNHHKFSPLRSAVPSSKAAGLYKVTAYCPCEICCGDFADGITASGRRATGLIVAAPPNIPFGTVLDIPGYGKAEVLDRGGAIKNNRLDVLFTDKDGVSGHQRALNWGVQELTVTFLEE